MKIRYWLLAMSFIFLSCGRVADDVAANYGIIPMPNELAPMQGVYVLQGEKTVAIYFCCFPTFSPSFHIDSLIFSLYNFHKYLKNKLFALY